MKKIFFLLALLASCFSVNAQFKDFTNPYRVVIVSPNYQNVYPRFSTLQNAYNSIKDSASVSTGKYFVINATSNYRNISDWTSAYKDSILARNPYIQLYTFGQAINDSIIGITTEEFQLIGGILSLNGLTAGNGLKFSNHIYSVNTGTYILITDDTLDVYVNPNEFEDTAPLGLNYKFNSGILVDTGGIGVGALLPLKVSHDTLKLLYKSPLRKNSGDTLELYYNDQQFETTEPFSIRLDSGVTSGANGIKILPDYPRLKFKGDALTINDNTAGVGLTWASDKINLLVAHPFNVSDSLYLNYNTDQFNVVYNASPSFNILLDSGITDNNVGQGLKLLVDWNTIKFNSSKKLTLNTALAGDGLSMSSNVINIVPNDFAKNENDTLKIKTSTLLTFWFDSVTTNVAYSFPVDTAGYGMFTSGKIKRWSASYFGSGGGGYTVDKESVSLSFVSSDRLQVYYDQGSEKFSIRKNNSNLSFMTLSDLSPPFYMKIVFTLEVFLEAQ